MIEHPVPQNITAYEFHLIGNMTLKQFFELLGSVGVALLVYSIALPNILKLFLVFIIIGTGAAFAFVPLEERPLDQWVVAFLHAIYKPTKFYWKKTIRIPDAFAYIQQKLGDRSQPLLDQKIGRSERVRAYFESISTQSEPNDLFVNSKNITQLFHNNKTPITLQQSKPHAQIQRVIPPATQPITTQQSTAEKQSHQPSSVLLKPSGKVTVFEAAQNKSKQQEERGETTQTLHTFAQNVIKTTTQQEIAVKTNSSLPFPSTPKQPNVVVGMVLDQNRKIVDGAIVEIVDQTGIAVRAVKTNKLGQFFITSPLQNGAFSIRTEKNGLEFNNYTLTTNNTIIPPLEFLAKTS